uniref:LBH domain-containing protein n=1 Tax=Echeneis naucrates TaxID=173247 RepID=A0A665UFM9_ECHNA
IELSTLRQNGFVAKFLIKNHILYIKTRMPRLVGLYIFPNPVEVVLCPETSSNSLDRDHGKERLPSIVVEPTEVSEVESGELRWPPENMDMEEDEEDLFLEQCIPPANIADWGEEEEEEEADEETSVILNQHQGLTLIDLQSDAFRDDTPTLPPSSAPALN